MRLGEAFAVIPLVKRGLPEAKLAFENPSVLGVAAGASIAGHAAQAPRARRGGEVGAALISLAPALFALRGGELAAYHGVEHKAIAAYEADDEDAADALKEHERCGSHLMAPMLAANLPGTLLLKRALEKPERRSPAAPSRSPRPPPRSRSSPGASATPTRPSRARSSAPATSSSACSARASPTSASSRSAAPRWPRSCASRID